VLVNILSLRQAVHIERSQPKLALG
jgi:hypothetical protein